jgi:hypothetical protein
MEPSSVLKKRIGDEMQTLIDSLNNLMKAAKIQHTGASHASLSGEMLEVYVEKMLASCRALLAVVADLKRNALLNDASARNAEVLSLLRTAGENYGSGLNFLTNNGAQSMDTTAG